MALNGVFKSTAPYYELNVRIECTCNTCLLTINVTFMCPTWYLPSYFGNQIYISTNEGDVMCINYKNIRVSLIKSKRITECEHWK